jgi:hypothetical protein
MPAVCALPASTRPSGAGSTESSRPSAGLAILLALLGLGATATALLGPLALGWIDYHVSSGAADQLRGGDVAGLVPTGQNTRPRSGVPLLILLFLLLRTRAGYAGKGRRPVTNATSSGTDFVAARTDSGVPTTYCGERQTT